MQRTAWVLVCVVGTLGCQRGSAPEVAKKEGAKSNGEVSQAVATDSDKSAVRKADFRTADLQTNEDSPAKLVRRFVAALQAGDARTVSNLLTDKARYETRRNGLEVRPQLFPNTAFEIQDTEFATASKDLAYVGCRWMEPSSDAQAFEIVWIAKRQDEGWRISGFSTPIVAGEDHKLLNFENVEEMLSVVDAGSGDEGASKSKNASNKRR